jgi:2-polyprenyl-3-methyl-5-hydroxy-6-metoxy-1,4-benzoquinol methylase
LAESSARLRADYTREYYVSDCGGYAEFGGTDALAIGDVRLRTTAAFSEIRSGRRALDIGCGRGEISAYLGARGWQVDAVDYSAEAIALAREHLARVGVPPERVRLVADDIDTFAFEPGAYDLIVAADVIEHLGVGELDRLYPRLARALAPNGLLVLHTFPNAWYYRYGWPRVRRAAAARGETLPENPRSAFERRMHISEQSPKDLARALRRSFAHSTLWLGDPQDPFRANLGTASREALRASPDIFAVAGHRGVDDVASSGAFMQEPIADVRRYKIRIEATGEPRAGADGATTVGVTIRNLGKRTLSSSGRYPVLVSYHVRNDDGSTAIYDGLRTPLGAPLRPGAAVRREVRIDPAGLPPRGTLRIALVQERVGWLDDAGAVADVRFSASEV